MSDAAQPTAAEVRTAAEAVKTALDRHLAAVERRSGDDDPAVYEAFNELAAAAEEYDELLYDRYDEVTPFEIPGTEDALPPYAGPEEPNALSVLIRRDYAVVEPQRLQAQAGRIEAIEAEETPGSRGADGAPHSPAASDTVHGALGILFGEFEPDEIASRHTEFGLEEGDSTVWVTATDDVPEPGEWLDAPFEQADAQHVVCRFDVSAVFDDQDDDVDDLDELDELEEVDELDELEEPDDELDDGSERAEAGPGDGGDAVGGPHAGVPGRRGAGNHGAGPDTPNDPVGAVGADDADDLERL